MTDSQTTSFKFLGSGSEYFKIWIVNSILTVLTLGIYSAWAKVRTSRYFYGNTRLDDATFDYHATPLMILKGRLIAITAVVAYIVASKFMPAVGGVLFIILLLLTPWVIWRSIRFNARMVSYRNVRFHFEGSLKEVYKILVFIPALPLIIGGALGGGLFFLTQNTEAIAFIISISVLAIYAMFPYIQQRMASYYINYRKYGQGHFSTHLSAKKYYRVYLSVIALSAVFTMVILMIIGFVLGLTGEIDRLMTMMEESGKIYPEDITRIVLFVYIGFGLLSIWGTAYIQANLKNYVLNHTQLDNVHVHSNIKVGKLFTLYLSNILLLFATLGLAYPWTVVRLRKYKLESTSITGNINEYVNQQQQTQSALGEELGEAFDMDVDLGI